MPTVPNAEPIPGPESGKKFCSSCFREIPANTKKCPFCGGKVSEKVLCGNCRHVIPDDRVFCPHCGFKRPGLTICPFCHRPTPSQLPRCVHCGEKIQASAPAAVQPEPKKKNGKLFALIGAAAAVLILALVLIFTLPKKTPEPSPTPDTSGVSAEADASSVGVSLVRSYVREKRIGGENLPLYIQYRNAVLDALDCHVLSEDIDAKKAQLAFSYVDVVALSDSFPGEPASADEFYQFCIDTIASGSAPTQQAVVDANIVTDENGSLRLEDSEELMNVLTGGAYAEMKRLAEEDQS